MNTISGNTRLFGIVADPISQVRTPQVLNQHFKDNNIDAVLVPFHVGVEGLESIFKAFKNLKNLNGFVVTVPHKTDAVDLCDEVTPQAKAIGSVNTIKRTSDGRLIGAMFDGLGFVEGLKSQGNDPKGKTVLLIGGGGAAAAIAHALVQSGTAKLAVTNRTISKAEKIVQSIKNVNPAANAEVSEPNPKGFDIIVNATSLGMKGSDALPIDTSLLTSENLVAEIIMKPEMTALLHKAQQSGCAIHLGRHMLDCQTKLMAKFMLDA